jgi:5-methylcytosine-specific restriction protein A
MAKPQYSGPWPQVRLYVLARDSYVCQLHLKGCTTRATTVDHIIELADGGTHDPTNCQAACLHCNSAKAAHRTNRMRWQRPQPSRQW